MRPEKLYLHDIVEAIDAIGRFRQDLDEESFRGHEMAQSAVLQKLAVIGEAASRLPKEVRDRYPDIEWRPIIGFRNIVVHEYFAVDLSIVWNTASRDVLVLREQVVSILESD